jgi:hypothetical protein
MAILRGFFDGTVIPVQPVLDSAGVDTFLAVSNNGPNVITVITSLGSHFPIENANSRAFFLPSGTTVSIDGPASTASWELAVPG